MDKLAPALAGQADSLPDLIIIPFVFDNHTHLHQPGFFQLVVGAGMDAMPHPGSLLSRLEYDKWNGQWAGRSPPFHKISQPDTQEMQIPLEAALSGQLAEDLAESGFTAHICKPNHNSAYVLRAPISHRAEVYDDEAATAARARP